MAAIHPPVILVDHSFSSSPSPSDHPYGTKLHGASAAATGVVAATVGRPIDNHHPRDWFYYVIDDNASDHCSHHNSHSHYQIHNHNNHPVCNAICNNHQYYLYKYLRRLYHGMRYMAAAASNDHRTTNPIPISSAVGVLFVAIACALALGVFVGFVWGKRKHGPVLIPNKTSLKMKKKTRWIGQLFERTQRQLKHPQEPKDGDEAEENDKNTLARVSLISSDEMERESGLSESELPQHVAVIMDGNRRYGEHRYGSRLRGHSDGSRTLLSFAKWCLAEHIPQLTVYALSTENWARHPAEIQHLMDIIQKHCQELRAEAIRRSIRVCIVSTNAHAIPQHVRNALEELRRDTQHGQRLRLNICLSYGGRGEIVAACQNILNQQQQQQQQPLNNNKMHDIRHPPKPITVTEQMIEQSLQLPSSPDVLIRTSNEYRLSNFLLWQLAYTELFFLDKYWPQVQKQDLLDVLREYAKRQRRYGK